MPPDIAPDLTLDPLSGTNKRYILHATQGGLRRRDTKGSTKGKKLTKDEILAALGKIDAYLPTRLDEFLRECQQEGFRVVTHKSIMIKSSIANFGEVNFGTLFPDGRLQTNYISDSAARIGEDAIAMDYLDGIAGLIQGATVRRDGAPWTWRVEIYGELPSISQSLACKDDWLNLMKSTRERFNRRATVLAAMGPS